MSDDGGAALDGTDIHVTAAAATPPGEFPDRLSDLRRLVGACAAADRRRLGRRLDRAVAAGASRRQLRQLRRDVERAARLMALRRAPLDGLEIPCALPIAGSAADIAGSVSANPVTIVCGETGSGKTTQLGKICLSLGRGVEGLIGHTQPRRIAARSVAMRIAEELGSTGGSVVGYKVRFDARVADACRLKLMTDGILLAEIQGDRALLGYDTLIVDEAHERSLNIDFVLGYLARLLPSRPDLRVIVSSATIDTERFSRFFGGAPVIEVAGRRYPVEVRYRPPAPDPEDGEAGGNSGPAGAASEAGGTAGVRGRPRARGGPRRAARPGAADFGLPGAVVAAVRELWREAGSRDRGGEQGERIERNEDILVFLPGEQDIHDTARELARARLPNLEVVKLYARLPFTQQKKVFEPHAATRVVLATNVAETSLTVPRIGRVIDAGLARIGRFSHRHAIQRLPVEPVSRASAIQRLGRAGRVAPGVCVRLYSQADLESRPEFTEPEIGRSDLCAVLLKLAALGIGEGDDFPFIDAPDRRHVNDGYRLLRELGAVGADLRLTPIGRRLARLPVDPRIGRMLLAALEHDCLKEVLVVASALSVPDPRGSGESLDPSAGSKSNGGGEAGAGARLARDDRSDFMALIELWNRVDEHRRASGRAEFRRWCERRGLSPARLWEWREVHDQLRTMVLELGSTRRTRAPRRTGRAGRGAQEASQKSHRAGYGQIHRALLAGLLRNVGMREGRREYAGVRDVRFHVSRASALAGSLPKWVMAAGLVETGRTYAHQAARVRPEWVERAAGDLLQRGHFEAHWDPHRAEAMVYEQTSLYGLTITPRRRVRFAPVSKRDARELFIRSALVEGQWRRELSVLEHNAAVVAELRTLDHKLRRPDVSVRDEDVFRFYDARLPAAVCDGATFEPYARRLEREAPDWLRLDAASLRHSPAPSGVEIDFPDRLCLSGLSPALDVALEYRLAPGAQSDGVTAVVLLSRLRELDPAPFEWLVPGRLAEKVTAMLRALPKSLRRELVPLPEAAADFSARARAAALPDEGLREALRRHLRSARGIDVPPSAWPSSAAALDAHLRMRFKIVDDAGATVATGRDLARLQAELNRTPGPEPKTAPGGAAPATSAGEWTFKDLPPSRFFDTPDGQVERFPALADRGRSVTLDWHASPPAARRAHGAGVRRLLALGCPELGVAVRQNLDTLDGANRRLTLVYSVLPGPPRPGPGMAELVEARQAGPSDRRDRAEELAPRGSGGLAEALSLALAERLIARYLQASRAGAPAGDAAAGPEIVTARSFAELRAFAAVEAGPAAGALCALAGSVLMRYHELAMSLAAGETRWPKASVADARTQLRHLVHTGFLLATPHAQLTHVERYLAALSLRLGKLDRGGAGDGRKLAFIEPMWSRYESRARSHAMRGRSDVELVRYRWMLEEFRVSLFAQELGTAYPVSSKRLDEQWRRVSG